MRWNLNQESLVIFRSPTGFDFFLFYFAMGKEPPTEEAQATQTTEQQAVAFWFSPDAPHLFSDTIYFSQEQLRLRYFATAPVGSLASLLFESLPTPQSDWQLR
jgi:hypothetical protein